MKRGSYIIHVKADSCKCFDVAAQAACLRVLPLAH